MGVLGNKRLLSGGVALLALCLGGCAVAPEPLSDTERLTEAKLDRRATFEANDALTQPLTLPEAFRRAAIYNLDARVKARETALAENALDLARLNLLPRVAIDGGYTARDNREASSSQSIATGQQSLATSTSSDKAITAGSLSLSWNILDFGISYFTAHQQANRILFAQEQRRKVVQMLQQDVRRAFWRAAAAQRLSGQIDSAIRAAQNALPAAYKVETEGLKSPVDSLRYQKALLEVITQLKTVQHGLESAKIELAALINLPPGQPYSLAIPSNSSIHLRYTKLPISDLEQTALLLNPDIRAQSYEVRISSDEARIALLKLIPGVNLSVSPNFSTNSFLLHQSWVTGAARVTGNLLDLLKIPETNERNEQTQALAVLRRQAVSAAVLTKLHLAYQEYASTAADYRLASQLANVDQRLFQQVRTKTATDVQGDLERVSAQVGSVFSKLRQYQTYAEAQAALGRLYSSLGVDPPDDPFGQLDIDHVGQTVRAAALHIESAVKSAAEKPAASPAGEQVAATPAGAEPSASTEPSSTQVQ